VFGGNGIARAIGARHGRARLTNPLGAPAPFFAPL